MTAPSRTEDYWTQETEEIVALRGDEIQFLKISGIFQSALPTAARQDDMPAETRFALSQWGTSMLEALQKEAGRVQSDKTPTVFFRVRVKWYLENEVPREAELDYEIMDPMTLVDSTPVSDI